MARARGNAAASRVDRAIGERIRKRRTELGLTQEQLAETLSVSYQQIQKYERGANRISAARLFELTGALDVDIAFFFEGLVRREPVEVPELEHGGRGRPAIELVRNFARIDDDDVRSGIAGLVKSVLERQADQSL